MCQLAYWVGWQLRQVSDDFEGGATLSEAMARHPRAFDRLYTNMVAAGEAGGVLDVILQRLAEFMEKAQRLKRKVIGAMIYPGVVVSFAMMIVTGIMIFVIPKFREIFKDFDAELPGLTLTLIGISNWFAGKKEIDNTLKTRGPPCTSKSSVSLACVSYSSR